MRRTLAITLLGLALGGQSVLAQRPELIRRSMEGPRMGLTYVSGRSAEDMLREHGLDRLMSQFGWHFEQQVVPSGRGPAFVIEQLVLVGAVEQRAVVPSFTFLMGIRTPSGFEFGMGPNLSPVGSALAVGIGKTINYGGVSLPINFAVVRSPGAVRTTILIGYAIQSSR
jgi:hypothetical protein